MDREETGPILAEFSGFLAEFIVEENIGKMFRDFDSNKLDIVWKFSKESKSGACREDFMRDTFVEHRLSKVMKYYTIRYHSLSRVTASLDQCNGLPRPT